MDRQKADVCDWVSSSSEQNSCSYQVLEIVVCDESICQEKKSEELLWSGKGTEEVDEDM